MHNDDGLWVGRVLLGDPMTFTHPVLHAIIAAFADSLVLIKLIPLVGQGLLAVAIYLILSQFSSHRWLTSILALTVLFYPVSPTQTFYVIGAHPTFGIAFGLYALYFFWKGWHAQGMQSYLLVALSGLFALTSSMTSPMCPLVAMAPLLWLSVAVVADRKVAWRSKRVLLQGGLLTIPLAIKIYDGLLLNAYTARGQDRVDPAVDNVIPALLNAFDVIATPLENWFVLLPAVLVLLALLWAGRGVIKTSTPRIDWRLPLMAVILSALVFAPNIAVSEEYLRSRYLFAPFVAGMVGLVAVILQLIDDAPRVARTVIAVLLMGLLLGESGWAYQRNDRVLGIQVRNYDAAMETAERERGNWPADAMVVFVVESGTKTPAPWWTTPMVNYFAGTDDVYAIVIGGDQLRAGLVGETFVGGKRNMTAHSLQRYVQIEQGVGIKGERPLFIYTRGGEEEQFEPAPLTVVVNSKEAVTVDHGQTPDKARRAGIDLFSESCEPIPGFVAFAAAAPAPAAEPALQLMASARSWAFEGSGTDTLSLSAQPGDLFALEFTLRTREPEKITRSRSPIAVLARSGKERFLVDNRQELFVIDYRGLTGRWRTLWPYDHSVGELEVSIFGRQGCRVMLSLDGAMLSFLPSESLITDWTLGGLGDRLWTGDVEDWRFYQARR